MRWTCLLSGAPFLLGSFALVACDGSSTADAGARADAAVQIDAGRDASSMDAATDVDSGAPSDDAGHDAGTSDAGLERCGSAEPDVSTVVGSEGVVIARDGTLYASQSGAVARVAPDGTREGSWASVGGPGATVWGLALDAANENLFVAVPNQGVYRIALEGAPSPMRIVSGGAPNGLVVGPDGMLYYSDFSAGRVYRVSPTGGTPSEVTTSRIASANGLAFEPEGTLLVASYSMGELVRLTLASGVETARAIGAPDGVALDATGRIYVTDNGAGNLLRLEPDGTGLTTLLRGISAAAGIEFGAGALRCADLYVASSGAMRRYSADAAGASVPWH